MGKQDMGGRTESKQVWVQDLAQVLDPVLTLGQPGAALGCSDLHQLSRYF